MAYVVTAQKPTKVTHSALGSFTSADDLNLIVARGTRFELHVATEEGLNPVFDVPVYGRIATMELFRPADEPKDLLFMSTERHGVCVLEFDAAKQQLVTRATGDVADPIGLGADCGQICSVDPQCRMIALHLIAGVLKVIPITNATRSLEAFNVRLDELQLLDMTMLHGTAQPTVAVLYQDNREARHVRTYKIDVAGKAASDGPWAKPNVDPGAAMLIPVPFGGVLIVGEQSIVYYNGTTARDVAVSGMSIKAYGRMDKDGSRYLLGDHIGGLHALVLKHEGGVVESLLIEPLGETSIASTISYLDNSVVFIGGCFGDSQLVKLNEEKDEETNSYLELLESHTNLGPIIDMAVLDLDRQGQGLVVTCSGASKDGSLRIVRNGIGIEEQAVIPLPGAKGVWSLRESFATPHDKYLVQSFIGETRIFEISEEKLDETEIAGFDHEVQTLLCGNMVGDTLLQVTNTVVRLVSVGAEGTEVARWAPDGGARVTVAACSPTQVLLALTGGVLVYLDASGGTLTEAKRKTMPHEISCLALNPLPAGDGDGAGAGAGASGGADGDTDMGVAEAAPLETAMLAVVGLWTDITARVVRLPSLEEVWQEALGGEIQPRSVLLTSLEGTAYVLVALGDGHLFIFGLDTATGALKDGRRVSLGTQPISLATFNTNGEQHVFAACDRPTVLYSSGGKLLFSNVNLGDVTTMCPFNSESFPDCLALASEADITIGTVDEIQKLHIRTVHLGEQPRRICHHKQSKCVAVCTIHTSIEKGEEVETNHLRLVDSTSFDVVGSYALQAFEMALSLTPVVFAGSDKEYIAVGTAYVYDDEEEPSSGRILVFSVVGAEGDRDVVLEADREIRGGAFALEAFQGGLIAGVNSVVQMYAWQEGEDVRALVAGPKHQGHILALNLQTRGHFVLVGDLMKSMTVLAYNEVEKRLDEIARDPAANWMSAVSILDDNTFIGAENSYNIFTCSKALDVLADEDHSRLLTSGAFHLGEFVNCFRHGSMVMDPTDSKVEEEADGSAPRASGDPAASGKGKGKGKGKAGTGAGAGAGAGATKPKPRLVFGTVNGALGVVATLPKPMFAFLSRMQTAMAKVVPGVGGFSHADWRAFRNERLPEPQPAHGFIDGDLVETFLDLDREKMVQVVSAMNSDGQGGDDGDVTVDALTRTVEDLVRLH